MKRLLGVTALSAILSALRMVSGFAIAKVIAVYTGPSGMAMLGQVQSLVAALNGIAAAPAGNGVVRYTAEHHSRGFDACAPWWRASLRWILWLLASMMLLVCFAAVPLSTWLFANDEYFWLIIVVAMVLPLSVLNALLASVINGLQDYTRYIGLGFLSVLVATAVMLGMIVAYRLTGALLAAAVFPALSGCIMLAGSARQPWFRLAYWVGKVDRKALSGVGAYVAMAITSAICTPVALVLIRKILVASADWNEAGQWQAVYKISEAYLGIITLGLSTYYLPRLSKLQGDEVRREVVNTAKIIIPIVVALAVAVYLLRDFAIELLFTQKFQQARNLFGVQLLGDVLKIASWLVAYPMLSRGAARWFIATEVTFSFLIAILAWLLVPKYGAQGANLAYALNYFLYLVFLLCNWKNIMNPRG
ncbi:O-antigen flippase [Ralstonia pickettii]|nr:O-antigen flippase [Ralstonia pickettii]